MMLQESNLRLQLLQLHTIIVLQVFMQLAHRIADHAKLCLVGIPKNGASRKARFHGSQLSAEV